MNGPRSLRSMPARLRRHPAWGSIAVVILLGLVSSMARTAGAATPCAPCALPIADNAMLDKSTTPAHAQLLGQKNLGSSTGSDGLKVKGWIPNTNFQAWNPEADGAEVCFSDGNPAGTFTGTTETLTGQAFDGTKGWVSNGSGTSHTYVDRSTAGKIVKAKVVQTPTAWKVLVSIKNADGSYGTTTPNADRPATATVYFRTPGGLSGCGHTTFVATDCEDNASSTTEVCRR